MSLQIQCDELGPKNQVQIVLIGSINIKNVDEVRMVLVHYANYNVVEIECSYLEKVGQCLYRLLVQYAQRRGECRVLRICNPSESIKRSLKFWALDRYIVNTPHGTQRTAGQYRCASGTPAKPQREHPNSTRFQDLGLKNSSRVQELIALAKLARQKKS